MCALHAQRATSNDENEDAEADEDAEQCTYSSMTSRSPAEHSVEDEDESQGIRIVRLQSGDIFYTCYLNVFNMSNVTCLV